MSPLNIRRIRDSHATGAIARTTHLLFATLTAEQVIEVGKEAYGRRIIRTLAGIQIGPRELELPPNMPVSDSAGRYDVEKHMSSKGY